MDDVARTQICRGQYTAASAISAGMVFPGALCFKDPVDSSSGFSGALAVAEIAVAHFRSEVTVSARWLDPVSISGDQFMRNQEAALRLKG